MLHRIPALLLPLKASAAKVISSTQRLGRYDVFAGAPLASELRNCDGQPVRQCIAEKTNVAQERPSSSAAESGTSCR